MCLINNLYSLIISQCVAFHDVNPVAPRHILVIPRKPIIQLSKSQDEDKPVRHHSIIFLHMQMLLISYFC